MPDVDLRFVLIPGAGGVGAYWDLVVPRLRAAGHEAIAVDLPGADPTAGLAEYAEIATEAARGAAGEVVLVAQSLGGFTAPLVCERVAVHGLVFVNAMIPVPGEQAGDWGRTVGSTAARIEAAQAGGYTTEFDLETYFLHDLSADLRQLVLSHPGDESEAVFASVCEFDAWPQVPTRVLVGADDRFFPPQFQRRVARERLGVEADVLPGGHLMAMSNPAGVADYLMDGAT
jgi:pimeloyl-ACP methyl ester carboxylesterase